MANVGVGDVVTVDGLEGVVQFVGTTGFATGVWVGVELRTKDGRNDGSVKGRRYFQCKRGHGIFVRPDRVAPGPAGGAGAAAAADAEVGGGGGARAPRPPTGGRRRGPPGNRGRGRGARRAGGRGAAAGAGATFSESYFAYPPSFIGRDDVELGGKILLPQSALQTLAGGTMRGPMLFELSNVNAARTTHCGVLEFIAEEGTMHIPYWRMSELLVGEGDVVRVRRATLRKGTFVKLQPQSEDFLSISNPKAVLEYAFRGFAALTVNETICITYNGTNYYLTVVQTRPDPAICIIDTNLEVDFEPPPGYVDPYTRDNASSNGTDLRKGKGVPLPAVGAVSAPGSEAQSRVEGGQLVFSSRSSSRSGLAPSPEPYKDAALTTTTATSSAGVASGGGSVPGARGGSRGGSRASSRASARSSRPSSDGSGMAAKAPALPPIGQQGSVVGGGASGSSGSSVGGVGTSGGAVFKTSGDSSKGGVSSSRGEGGERGSGSNSGSESENDDDAEPDFVPFSGAGRVLGGPGPSSAASGRTQPNISSGASGGGASGGGSGGSGALVFGGSSGTGGVSRRATPSSRLSESSLSDNDSDSDSGSTSESESDSESGDGGGGSGFVPFSGPGRTLS